jgi:hypothetical protein
MHDAESQLNILRKRSLRLKGDLKAIVGGFEYGKIDSLIGAFAIAIARISKVSLEATEAVRAHLLQVLTSLGFFMKNECRDHTLPPTSPNEAYLRLTRPANSHWNGRVNSLRLLHGLVQPIPEDARTRRSTRHSGHWIRLGA